MNKTLNKACDLLHENYSHVLEFGVYSGKSILQLRQRLDKKYQIFGFDSFVGLPEDWSGTTHRKGDMSRNGHVPNIPMVRFYKGWFEDTIPQYLSEHSEPIALLHIDCDLYSSTKTVLYNLNSFIQPGTIIVFDEWFYNHDPKFNDHEQKAFYEWVTDHDIKFKLYGQLEDERQIVIIE